MALAAAAALLPAAPALAQTATPTPTPSATPAPAAPQLRIDRAVIDHGQTVELRVLGRPGARVQLFGNFRQIREATIGPLDDRFEAGTAAWTLQPGDRTLFSAVVDGVRTEDLTVTVRRTLTIGVSQFGGFYTFSGQIARAEGGVQVTIARLDSETSRVTGVVSTRTDAAGRYVVRTPLPQGLAGYYALTAGDANQAAGRSRLYGLLVNVVPRP